MRRSFIYAPLVTLLVALGANGAATPKEAVGFWGQVTGTVKATQADGLSFRLTVSNVEPDAQSTAKNPAGMIGKVITLGTRMPKNTPNTDDVAYIKSLKIGDVITIKIFALMAAPNILRMHGPGVPATQPAAKRGDTDAAI